MKPHKFRASSIAEIMTEPKSKTEVLSVGAKTAIMKLAKQFVYGYDEQISSRQMDKGLQVEDASIELLNSVFFANYKKNTERKSNEWITGECDIYVPGEKVIDVKSSWSLPTFPAVSQDGEEKTYEWQGRAYMWLWDVEAFEVCYCLVNTPDELIGYEDPSIHYVDHIAEEMRVTRLIYTRDRELEKAMQTKVEAARGYMELMVKTIAQQHTY
jgi:hypothetical protein